MAERVAVVTGASRGIGVVIAEDLAADGGVIVLSARDEAGLKATAARVEAKGARAVVVPGDLTRAEDRARLVAEVTRLGAPDVLVNNAGVEVCMAALDQTEAEITQQIQVNLLAPLLLTRALAPGMVAAGRGVIVMISSMSGKSPTPYNAIYTASKFGLNGFTASLRLELEGTGVHLGVVCPSFVAEAGMFSDTGVAAPASMREVTPAQVVRGVRKVIGGASEVLVTPTPVRPMLALGQFFPNIDGPALRLLGVMDVLKKRAEVTLQRRRGPGSAG